MSPDRADGQAALPGHVLGATCNYSPVCKHIQAFDLLRRSQPPASQIMPVFPAAIPKSRHHATDNDRTTANRAAHRSRACGARAPLLVTSLSSCFIIACPALTLADSGGKLEAKVLFYATRTRQTLSSGFPYKHTHIFSQRL